MKPFMVDQEFWDSLDEKGKAKLKETLSQKEDYDKKNLEAEYSSKLEQQKETIKSQLTEEQKAKAEQEKFLAGVPEENKKIVSGMISKGFTPDEITKEYSELMKPKEKPIVDLNEVINGKIGDKVEVNPAQEQSDEALIKEVKERGLPKPKDQYDTETINKWERYAELKKDGKIK